MLVMKLCFDAMLCSNFNLGNENCDAGHLHVGPHFLAHKLQVPNPRPWHWVTCII